ncbi:hypothetical protein ACIP1G_03545 [Pseudomonas sp. NPDC089392]|uniref:hypothetical protein n=1 Tax=Pseudomonas sp. NPDC089392 TaxID=3364459 RepID=UPI003818B570
MSDALPKDLFKRYRRPEKLKALPGLIKNRLMTHDPKARGLWLLTAVTLCYLFVEFAFSAALLGVMAGNDTHDIESAEQFGRVLSGFAVALLFWPVVFARSRDWGLIGGILVLGSAAVIYAVAQGERKLIDSLVERSTAESRAAAVTGTLLRQGLATNTISADMLEGLWSGATAQSTAGKAFVSVVAYIATESDSALAQTLVLAPDVVRGVIEQDTGGLDREYQRYLESQDSIRNRYNNRYVQGLADFRKEMNKVPARANRMWEDYLDRLDAKNRDWGRARIGRARTGNELVPAFVAPRVRAEVRKMGLDVKDSWRTGDKATFVRLAEASLRKHMQESLAKQLDGLPYNLSLEAFAAHPTVQRKWRLELQYPENVSGLSLASLSRAQFEQRYYQRALSGRTRDGLEKYAGQVADHRDGGPREAEGKKAYEAMIAPVFALTLSLLGAMVHLGKSVLLLIQVKSGWRFKNALIKSCCLASGILLVLLLGRVFISTDLTSHPTYQAWTRASGQQSAGAYALDTMIKVETLAYPVLNVPRQMILYVVKKVDERARAQREQARSNTGA